MDVINLSLGEPEIDARARHRRQAINAAADAGVVPVIAAGNDYDATRARLGRLARLSAAKAITAAAVTKSGVIASFSSGGPDPGLARR